MTAAASKRILIVDDEQDVVEALQYTMEDDGYAVVTAITVEEALAKVAEGPFDAAVLDVSMGETDGLDVARQLRNSPVTAHIPIVILSGVDEKVLRKRFTGYDLFMSKGADLSGLVKHLELLIGGATGPREDPQLPSS